MTVKIIMTLGEKGLERKINEFLEYLNDENLEVLEIQYKASIFYVSAMIIYK